MSRIAVIAFGGNALVRDSQHDAIPDQYATVCATARPLVDLIERGWRLVVSHGNGPQVGFILRRSEMSLAEVDPVPIDYAVADTQGAIGFMFVKALTNEMVRRGLKRDVVAVVTQTVVDSLDAAFRNPTKPVGSFLDESIAKARRDELGWTIMEDAGRGWRRTVASPRPKRIVESKIIADLLARGAIVVAAGGGGIPVAIGPDGTVAGIEAVVDKDLACSLLAREISANMLIIPTAVPRVAINFGKSNQKWLDSLTVEEARCYIGSGEFGNGSMEPKVAAIADFVESQPGAVGAIGAAEDIAAIIEGRAGTRIVGTTPSADAKIDSIATADAALLAVNGTLMRGLKLNPNMIAAGATFLREATTEPTYRLWTINDDHPAMVRVTDGTGVSVAVELWSVPAAGLAGILLDEPTGLAIGKVNLSDGTTVLGVIGESVLVEGQREISQHGGWRQYVKIEGISS